MLQKSLQKVRHWFDSLKNRAVGVVVLVVVLITFTATLVGIAVGQQELESQARSQLETHAGLIADNIDAKLAERFDAITQAARSLTMNEESLIGRAQLVLERQAALDALFHRIYLIDSSGIVRAAVPGADNTEAVGVDVTDRNYFQLTSQQLTTLISQPFVSRDENIPVVAVTSPIFDHKRQMIGMLLGTINLDERSFLGQLKSLKIGETGYVSVGTRSGMGLVHARQREALKPLNMVDSVYQQATKGAEGVSLVREEEGVKSLVAYRQLNEAPWFVTVALPTSEAFAPIRALSRVMFWVAFGVLALFIPLSLRLFTRLLNPLPQLAEQIRERHAGRREKPVDVGGGQEIQELVDTFNLVRQEREAARFELEQQEAYFRSLSERSPVGIIQTDVLGRIVFANPAFEAILGVAFEHLSNRPILMAVHQGDHRQVLADWQEVLRTGEMRQGEYRLYDRRTNRTIWVSMATSPIQTQDRSLGTISVIRDITRELEIEAELRVARDRAESILGALHEGVIMTDSNGRISFANPPAHVFLGVDDAIVGQGLFELIRVEVGGAPWDFAKFSQQRQLTDLDAIMTNIRHVSFEVELSMLHTEGEYSAGQFVFVLRDDSERRRQEERLSWEASHDALTRLHNRRAFTATLSNLVDQNAGDDNVSVVMMIDLDHFKPVNDQGGHLLGDELLRHLADLLRSRVRQSDMVARLGGDEFGVILPGCGLERAAAIAESLRSGIEALVLEQDGRHFSVTASIGMTGILASDASVKAVLARADEGAYAAKSRGRNQVVVQAPETAGS
ncbi:sensor domain-containing diguanylate cyclase [Marinobacter fonticola]|uniref:sensor domain-containing diguanylate cyclase n=1 Tax=Marinobacter fonticola TaxID=2603215 RepID=UPI0011E6ACCE|nr:diguanylate cyclase [Marinobacter fonticola]